MRFAYAEILWLLALVPLLGLAAWLRLRAGRRVLAEALKGPMAGRLTAHLSGGAREWRLLVLLVALVCLILGAARPQRGTQYVTAKRMGGDVIFALDVSESMLAEDIKPNRLQRARHEISAVLDRLKGDRVGLIAFSGEAFIQCPLTLDYSAARMFLDYMTPDLIPQPGTNLGEALRVATRAFGGEGEDQGHRALVLITDGEDHAGDYLAAAREAREARIRVFTVGLGSEAGEPIARRDASGRIQGYKEDREGRVVMTRLEEEPLKRVAEETGGAYVRAGGTLGLQRIVDAIEGMEKRELESGVRVLYEERYRYFVWPALILLLFELWIPLRRGAIRRRWLFAGRIAASALVIAFAAGSHLPPVQAQRPTPAHAQGQRPATHGQPQTQWLGPGAAANRNPSTASTPGAPNQPSATPGSNATGQYSDERWRELFEENEVFRGKHPEDARPCFNLGNLHHDRAEWDEAIRAFDQAKARAKEDLAARVQYNLGNTLFAKGDLQAAREAFVDALRADPEDEDAKRNLELTQRMLDQAQADSSQSGDQGQQNQQQDQQDGQQQQQDQQQSEQNEQDQQQQDQQQQQSQQQQQDQQQSEQQDREQQDDQQQQQQQQQQEQQEQQEQDQQQEQQGQEAQMGDEQRDENEAKDAAQAMQILRGLEARERDLLKERFRARSRNVRVEKDW